MQICLLLSSCISWHPSISDHSQYSLTTLILIFLLFLFRLVSPEILSLRAYHHIFLRDGLPILIFLLFLLLQYLVLYINLVCNNFTRRGRAQRGNPQSSKFSVPSPVIYVVYSLHPPLPLLCSLQRTNPSSRYISFKCLMTIFTLLLEMGIYNTDVMFVCLIPCFPTLNNSTMNM